MTFNGQRTLISVNVIVNSQNDCHDPLPVVISLVAVASQDLVEAGDKAEVTIIELRNFDKLT